MKVSPEIKKFQELLEKELTRIVGILKRKYQPEKIVLFGSFANGKTHEGSDIDLMIVKETRERFIDRLHRVRLMTRPEVGVDFIVYTPREVNDMRREKRRFFIKEILGNGKILYEKQK